MPQGPQCNRDTNQFVKPGGLCQCDPATQAQATPLGCEEIGSSLRPFAEFTVDQDSATPLAGLIHYFFALNGVTQDTCRGACLGETECIGYTYGEWSQGLRRGSRRDCRQPDLTFYNVQIPPGAPVEHLALVGCTTPKRPQGSTLSVTGGCILLPPQECLLSNRN